MNTMRTSKKYEDLIYDVGMCKGEDTDFYLKKGFRVVGFEADPDLVTYCNNRFINEIQKGNLIIVEGAIVDLSQGESQGKTIKFFRNKDKCVWGTVCEDWKERNEFLGTSTEVLEVPTINFSDCLKKYGIPHYLKIDIEGMDMVCLRALIDFEEKPDYVSMESEKICFDKLGKEFNLFKLLGYNKFKAIQQVGISYQREPKYTKEGHYVGYKFHEGSSGLFGSDLPGKWKNYRQILNEYKIIFFFYKYFGDYGKLRRTFIGKVITGIAWRFLRKCIPGWYDTHAWHSGS